jgi:hypothetical protein
MTLITLQDGKIVLRDGKVGTEQECCCEQEDCCESVVWHRVHGACNGLPDDFVTAAVDENCYAYYTWDDWDCQNALVGRDCGDDGQCDIFARVKITGNTPGAIEYLQSNDPDVWAEGTPGGFCDCPDSFGSLSVSCAGCPPCPECEVPELTPGNCEEYFPPGAQPDGTASGQFLKSCDCLPPGVTWKPGYPGKLAGCKCVVIIDHYDAACDGGGFFLFTRRKEVWRIATIDCEAGSFTDITSLAWDGPIALGTIGSPNTPVWSVRCGDFCRLSPEDCTSFEVPGMVNGPDFPADLPLPAPDCNPLP